MSEDTDQVYVHEMFDHPATPAGSDTPHDYRVPQQFCRRCHDNAHAQYEQDVNEVLDGSVHRDHPTHAINPDDTDRLGRRIYHGPTAFLLNYHALNGYPCLEG